METSAELEWAVWPMSHDVEKAIEDDEDLSRLYRILSKGFVYHAPAEDSEVKDLMIRINRRLNEANPLTPEFS